MNRVLILENLEPGQTPWWQQHIEPRQDIQFDIECVPESSMLRSIPKLLKVYRKLKLQGYEAIITNQDGYATFLFATLNSLLRRRRPFHFVVEFITKEQNGSLYSRIKYAVLRRILRSVTRFVCSAGRELEIYPRQLQLPPERFAHIPLMTNPKFLEWEKPDAPGQEYIFAGGRTGRDFATFFDAVRGLDSRVRVITSPHVVAGLEIPSNVELLFNLPFSTYIEHVKNATIVVVPLANRQISVGQSVILEAMALGRPLITTEAPGSVDYVESNVTGIMVPQGDPKALRAAIEALVADPVRASTMAACARARVREKFVPSRVRGELADLIRETLSASP